MAFPLSIEGSACFDVRSPEASLLKAIDTVQKMLPRKRGNTTEIGDTSVSFTVNAFAWRLSIDPMARCEGGRIDFGVRDNQLAVTFRFEVVRVMLVFTALFGAIAAIQLSHVSSSKLPAAILLQAGIWSVIVGANFLLARAMLKWWLLSGLTEALRVSPTPCRDV
jgi:hypothetical protein